MPPSAQPGTVEFQRPPVRGRILVVDDHESLRGIVRTFLHRAGFIVCGEADNGVEAIEQAKRLKPDLVVIDLAMPGMNGVEAASVISRTMPNVPIIALTMYEEHFGPTLAAAVGVKAIVSKTDGLDKLVDRVQSLLSLPKQQTDDPGTVTP
jgi:DNA-binding NarL/FixJ family response regulator